MWARRRSQHTEVQIWDLGASSYHAYVHLVPLAPGLDLFQSAVFVVSVDGPTLQKVLAARFTSTPNSTADDPMSDRR